MKTSRITKEEGVAAILVDIERNGRARPRRHYAAEWDISPTTVYYWIKEAEQRAGAAVS